MATIYCTATSLDGFIADEAASLSWLFSTQNHESDPGGRYGDDDSLDFDRFYANVGAVVLGATTFEWIKSQEERGDGVGWWPYDKPSWVCTHRDLDVPEGVQVFAGDVSQLHPRLREAAGERDVWIVGGGDLAGQFADAGLLDRVWIHQCPVTLGAGAPLLPRALRLRRVGLARDGQFTAMLFDVVGPEGSS